MQYFQNVKEGEAPKIPEFKPPHQTDLYAGSPINRFMSGGNQPYFQSILPPPPPPREKNPTKIPSQPPPDDGMAAGGQVPIESSLGPMSVAAGGIAGLPQGGQPPPQEQPEQQDIQMLAMAISGRMEEQQVNMVVESFIQKYGVDTFRAVREMILKSANPNAQTEGVIEGQGGGMADQVPGMIGDQQPVAVSPGEFIVPADVVSGLGNGSTDAGVEQLDQMMGNVRQARQGGSTSQPPQIDPKMMLPQ
jgi:hypothetical protein